MITITLTDRELATVLASLRALQAVQQHEPPAPEIAEIASNSGTLEPLEDGEVDTLCERLNTNTETALQVTLGLTRGASATVSFPLTPALSLAGERESRRAVPIRARITDTALYYDDSTRDR